MVDHVDDEWVPPTGSYHAHFDCFSGAAGDMMLAGCLDAAGGEEAKARLLRHVVRSLEEGMPELKGEFSIATQRVWRGVGSICACHVRVDSKYHHDAAPPPMPDHDHSHDHDHEHEHDHNHRHSHSDSPEASRSDDSGHHDHGHSHSHSHSSPNVKGPLRNLPQIRKMLRDADERHISPWVKDRAIAAFTALAQAEAQTHGAATMDAVHFHEVGAVDSIVDTVGTLIALRGLGVTTISCSRLPLGEGTVWTSHGCLPVPAPATLRLMVDMPTCPGPRGVGIGELVTPTAAALLKVCIQLSPSPQQRQSVTGRPPAFTVLKVGIGAGTKDFKDHPNILRVILGNNLEEEANGQN